MNVKGNKYRVVKVSSYGAKGDGYTDDGPAVLKAYEDAISAGGNAILEFDSGKKYFLGEYKQRWHYFKIDKIKNLTIDGNGSEIILTNKNNMLQIKDSKNIAIKNLFIDHSQSTYIQGVIVNVNPRNLTFDLKIDAPALGYMIPPVEFVDPDNPKDTTWTILNDFKYTGGQHGIIFDEDGTKRATINIETKDIDTPEGLAMNHFRAISITKLSEDTYRFDLRNGNRNQVSQLKKGYRVTYGMYQTLKMIKSLTSGELDETDLLPIANINIIDTADVMMDNITIYSSMGKGIYLRGNSGKITLTGVNIIRKPGTDRLLSTMSDGIHAQRNRAAVLMENCRIEFTGDDAMAIPMNNHDPVINYLNNNTLVMWLKGTKVGDEFIFVNFNDKQLLGRAKVQKIKIKSETGVLNEEIRFEDLDDLTVAEVTFDKDIIGIMPCSTWYPALENTWAINTSQYASGTTIRNCRFVSCIRNSLIIKGANVILVNNTFDGTPGGATAINISVTGENIYACGNTINGYIEFGISASTPAALKLIDGVSLSNNIIDMNNRFNSVDIKGINLVNINNYKLDKNSVSMPENLRRQAISIINSKAAAAQ